jgi:ABC-2 type transport system ATP-binding protein
MNSSLIKFNNVTKMYNEEKGIKNVSFSIKKGEIHGIIGSNGAGKTSIIKTVLNHLKVDSGTILFKDKPLSHMKEFNSFKKHVGYVPDDEVLLENLTPLEIVDFVSKAYGLSSKETLDNAKNLFNLLQLKEVNQNVNLFSRGMKKKVQLVSALCVNPELLILDEPISGFDPNVIYLLKKLLLSLRDHGKAIFISTHDLNIATQLCDRVTMIHNGEVLLSGKTSDVLLEHNVRTLEELFISKTLNADNEELLRNVVANL